MSKKSGDGGGTHNSNSHNHHPHVQTPDEIRGALNETIVSGISGGLHNQSLDSGTSLPSRIPLM